MSDTPQGTMPSNHPSQVDVGLYEQELGQVAAQEPLDRVQVVHDEDQSS